ncbi:MAG: Crp/Fnr family transcriptional regulator [Anaerolineae bacterium]|nr:Crp/Fnr family transcriptional regulator [Anaerolineae bacterium]
MTGVHFLRNVSLLANLSTTELEPLAQRLISRTYRTGDIILRQGDISSSMYIVKSGSVDIRVTAADGEVKTLATFGPGQVFGEFALLDGLPRSADAIAQERSELLILTRPEFFMYLEQHPAVAINLLVLISRRLRFTLQRTEDEEHGGSTLAKIAELLVRLAERYGEQIDNNLQLAIRLTRGELAGVIGCPRSDAESALETLRQKGIIDLHGRHMTIYDLAELKAMALD